MKQIASLSLILGLFTTLSLHRAAPALANYQYGNGEPSSQIIIDKQLKPDDGTTWSDNLSADSHAFVAGEKVDYKLIVKNTGEKELKNVKVTDRLPDHLNFVIASDGYSRNGQEVTWTIAALAAGEQKEFQIQAQLDDSGQLGDLTDFCANNYAKAQAESGESDEDWAQLCVRTQVLGAKELPEAGAGLWLGAISGLTLGSFGIYLKRK